MTRLERIMTSWRLLFFLGVLLFAALGHGLVGPRPALAQSPPGQAVLPAPPPCPSRHVVHAAVGPQARCGHWRRPSGGAELGPAR